MGHVLGGTTRMYAFYIAFMLILIGMVAVFSDSAPPKALAGELQMNVFIRDMACSGSSGEVTLQSWDYNDYPLPGVLLRIPKLGDFETDSEGLARIGGIANGAYYVSASKENYKGRYFEFVVSCPKKNIAIAPER